MAHTSHSFGPSSDYEDRADPTFWANVLKPDAFPRLRINLAHLGHFNKAVQYARPVNYVDKCWEWTIGKILTGSTEAYAYADISSLGEILKTGPSRKIVECMKAFKEHFPNSHERLLYGTDWSMIAQEERFPRLLSSKPFPDVMISGKILCCPQLGHRLDERLRLIGNYILLMPRAAAVPIRRRSLLAL